jgi:hypothetical protein
MILNCATASPQNFNGDLKRVSISRSAAAFMSNQRYYNKQNGAYSVASGNIITIHNHDFSLGGGNVFNPLHEVKGAMKAIAAKQPLTFNQEYAIESIWHEIRHAGAVGWKDIRRKTKSLTDTMECINQFCARRSYNQFLSSIGGKAVHRKAIMSGGYGYSGLVRNFDKILEVNNISSSNAYAYFNKAILSEPYENIQDCVITYLAKNGLARKKAEELIKAIKYSAKDFDTLL